MGGSTARKAGEQGFGTSRPTLPPPHRLSTGWDMLLVIAVVRQADPGRIVPNLVAPGFAGMDAERGIGVDGVGATCPGRPTL